ncbi:hypothetical protein SESBI_41021 [Sesbania bispinosa]|nr:hypothetical protein SESBI_41021 [Sesbania bispinosa]
MESGNPAPRQRDMAFSPAFAQGRGSRRMESYRDSKKRAAEQPVERSSYDGHGHAPDPIKETISIIAGGFIGGGVTDLACKCYMSGRSVMAVEKVVEEPRGVAITFDDADYDGMEPCRDDPMIVIIRAANFNLMRVLVDQGSSEDILYYSTFKRLELSEEKLLPFLGLLTSFLGESVEVIGYDDLMTMFGVR